MAKRVRISEPSLDNAMSPLYALLLNELNRFSRDLVDIVLDYGKEFIPLSQWQNFYAPLAEHWMCCWGSDGNVWAVGRCSGNAFSLKNNQRVSLPRPALFYDVVQGNGPMSMLLFSMKPVRAGQDFLAGRLFNIDIFDLSTGPQPCDTLRIRFNDIVSVTEFTIAQETDASFAFYRRSTDGNRLIYVKFEWNHMEQMWVQVSDLETVVVTASRGNIIGPFNVWNKDAIAFTERAKFTYRPINQCCLSQKDIVTVVGQDIFVNGTHMTADDQLQLDRQTQFVRTPKGSVWLVNPEKKARLYGWKWKCGNLRMFIVWMVLRPVPRLSVSFGFDNLVLFNFESFVTVFIVQQ